MTGERRWITHSPEETAQLGAALARESRQGDIFALYGDLASGKTTFIKGFCGELNVEGPVTSPTFTLINEYPGRLPVYHFDCYRLDSHEELYDLGYEEYFYGDGVVAIEWADRAEALLPPSAVRLDFRHDFGRENTRTIILQTSSEREDLCSSLP